MAWLSTYYFQVITDWIVLKPFCWYGMRSWIECLFKDLKRGGFGWHDTKIWRCTIMGWFGNFGFWILDFGLFELPVNFDFWVQTRHVLSLWWNWHHPAIMQCPTDNCLNLLINHEGWYLIFLLLPKQRARVDEKRTQLERTGGWRFLRIDPLLKPSSRLLVLLKQFIDSNSSADPLLYLPSRTAPSTSHFNHNFIRWRSLSGTGILKTLWVEMVSGT